MIRLSNPSSRVCPFATICGSKLPLRSRGTAISIARHRRSRSCSNTHCGCCRRRGRPDRPSHIPDVRSLGTERTFQQALLEFLEQPLLAEQILRRAVALHQLLDEFVPDRLEPSEGAALVSADQPG